MSETPASPSTSNNTINGPFNKMTVIENSNGVTILDNTLGIIFLGLVAIFLIFEVARLSDANRKLSNP